jgi:subtilisin family serine protease
MSSSDPSIVANVILTSDSGKSIRDARLTMTHKNVHEFLPRATTLDTARGALEKRGFHIDFVAETHLSISGPKDLFEQVFQVRLIQQPLSSILGPGRAKYPYFASTVPPSIPRELVDVIETISFPAPVRYETSSTPPELPYPHLNAPDDIAMQMDALRAHASGITGAGVKLAIVDSGFMTPWHPFYVNKEYLIRDVVSDPHDPNPGDDAWGHGTAIAASALAVAPGVTLTVYKDSLQGGATAFARAVKAGSHIISCSWDMPEFDHALHLAINHAVSKGVTVVFSCGNEGHVGWPGCEAAVLSVGGSFIRPDGTIEASDYASSGMNTNEPGRQVPDLCGIVGMRPHGVLIALPTQPGSDRDRAGAMSGPYPEGDATLPDDGWTVFSGTSNAAPMVAGVAALVMQANPSTVGNPDAVRALLIGSCIDVIEGVSASNEHAGPGVDLATGAGLVQAFRAIGGMAERAGQKRKAEGGRSMAGTGSEIRSWLFMRVDDPHAAAQVLHGLVLAQQWSPDWSIKRVDTVDHGASSKLARFPAPSDGFNLFVAVKAATENYLHIAFLTIENLVQPSKARVPNAHVLTSSTYLNWP